ncbi:MAG: NAD(P)-dependent oxidoreductase [Firmicutes bacterium]|nr:NAD(P)-dependent oxidoreductase [Bacillota bacterium]
MRIGFIGTGVMGASMVKNLLKNGYEVNVYNRTPSKAKALEEFGAHFTESIKDCVSDADIAITIVGMPEDVRECYEEILKYLKGHIAIDMTTSSPSLAKEIYHKAKELGISVLDAPVSGGDTGAKNGTLSIMVGGDLDTFNECMPVFEAMGKTINYIGETGSGQHTKMANQILIAGTIGAVAEALTYARYMNLDERKVFEAIANGAAGSWQLSNNGLKMLNHDDNPGFFIKHFIKDMKLADDEATNKNLNLEVLKTVLEEYKKLQDEGYEDLGTQALYKLYD